MGVHLLDYLQLEDAVALCERCGRWEFLVAAAPLRIVGGTGSPLEPDRGLLIETIIHDSGREKIIRSGGRTGRTPR